jgi:hypothetical protein
MLFVQGALDPGSQITSQEHMLHFPFMQVCVPLHESFLQGLVSVSLQDIFEGSGIVS